jgi:lipoate-protein ligase A
MTVNEDLLDTYLTEREPLFRIYEPKSVMVVMGAGRKNKDDLAKQKIETDGVPVYLRRGGGGTVVLSPGMVVLALVTEVDSPFHNREYALKINGWFREVLNGFGITGIHDRGISDLTLGERKILGVTLYRKRHVLFYQSSLLVQNDLSLFTRYLTFPDRVPDYREGRSHEDFCTTLEDEGYNLQIPEMMRCLEEVVKRELGHL